MLTYCFLSLKIPKKADYSEKDVKYKRDYHEDVVNFTRVAYFLELESYSGLIEYVWVSFDGHTNDPSLLGVPTFQSGAVFQEEVTGLNVYSSRNDTITSGEGFIGNLEFWPTTYIPGNEANVDGASDITYDIGDTNTGFGSYGSMQVHNTDTTETVFAFNRWSPASKAQGKLPVDLGIGNSVLADSRDWTGAANGDTYKKRNLKIFILGFLEKKKKSMKMSKAGTKGSTKNKKHKKGKNVQTLSKLEMISRLPISSVLFFIALGVVIGGTVFMATQGVAQ